MRHKAVDPQSMATLEAFAHVSDCLFECQVQDSYLRIELDSVTSWLRSLLHTQGLPPPAARFQRLVTCCRPTFKAPRASNSSHGSRWAFQELNGCPEQLQVLSQSCLQQSEARRGPSHGRHDATSSASSCRKLPRLSAFTPPFGGTCFTARWTPCR